MRYRWYERVFAHAVDLACVASDALVERSAGVQARADLEAWSALASLVESLDSQVPPSLARGALLDVVSYLRSALEDVFDEEAL